MLILVDFKCSNCGYWEDLVESDTRAASCPQCGENSVREITSKRMRFRVKHPGVQDSTPYWLNGESVLKDEYVSWRNWNVPKFDPLYKKSTITRDDEKAYKERYGLLSRDE